MRLQPGCRSVDRSGGRAHDISADLSAGARCILCLFKAGGNCQYRASAYLAEPIERNRTDSQFQRVDVFWRIVLGTGRHWRISVRCWFIVLRAIIGGYAKASISCMRSQSSGQKKQGSRTFSAWKSRRSIRRPWQRAMTSYARCTAAVRAASTNRHPQRFGKGDANSACGCGSRLNIHKIKERRFYNLRSFIGAPTHFISELFCAFQLGKRYCFRSVLVIVCKSYPVVIHIDRIDKTVYQSLFSFLCG